MLFVLEAVVELGKVEGVRSAIEEDEAVLVFPVG